MASPTVTSIATGTFTVTSTATQYSVNIAVPAAATTGIQILFTVGAQISGTWTIGNVQLEPGTVATPFERQLYNAQLAQCQRYFAQFGGSSTNDNVGAGQAIAAGAAQISIRFPVPMRTNPTLDTFTASNWSVLNGSASLVACTAIALAGGQTSVYGTQLSITVASGLTAGQGSSLLANTVNARLPLNAEL